ncbi:hypothetical protein MMC07_001745 [Pseudocyphellaria aurata]|nr:hypothetical protein [Pseudocyphellaria aurata]
MSIVSFKEALNEGDFYSILASSSARFIFGHHDDDDDGVPSSLSWQSCGGDWNAFLYRRASHLLDQSVQDLVLRENLFHIGVAALNAFLQANVTGPPLSWASTDLILPQALRGDADQLKRLERQLILDLSIDGETVYQLTPRVEIFCLAKCLLHHPKIVGEDAFYVWGRLRVNSWHQRMLNENVDSLQQNIYDDLDIVHQSILNQTSKIKAQFLIERATIHIQYGFDMRASEDLKSAARETQLEFALTGRLGKRTKFQQNQLSQLVVLAKSAPEETSEDDSTHRKIPNYANQRLDVDKSESSSKPINLDLNDDTLLEAISFSKEPQASAIANDETLPLALKSLDPTDQPALMPLDSIILLAIASSITNTSPQDGLTREETLPYATRVLVGGSTNWQVYTQALLVRSRIEGYRSRTVERGVLQLQAVVDQVIAETTVNNPSVASDSLQASEESISTTFLPRPKASESAPVSERLLYIHQLASPTRWKLEAELADRWVSLGSLRTALEIYERLQMWAEVALCWAASDREDEARKILRKQLYEPSSTGQELKPTERVPLPADAPRLFCILGDMEKSPTAYDRAWEVSKSRYSRAQRSLGRHYLAVHNLTKAGEAYEKSLKISPHNHSAWFALGSVRLQLEDWTGAVDAFGKAIQIEDKDAESWSNLAVALLKLSSQMSVNNPSISDLDPGGRDIGNNEESKSATNPQKHLMEAFVALKRAAVLKRESYRIWQNLLTVAIKLSPPPYTDIIIAQTRLVELLGNLEGEKCVDIDVVEGLVAHLISSSSIQSAASQSIQQSTTDSESSGNEALLPSENQQSRKPGFSKMLIDLVQKKITPLITTSRRLWLLTAKLSLYLNHPFATLGAYEKAWRVTLNKPGWESGTKEAEADWQEVIHATVELADCYESLGERKREAGMGEGELVCKEWRFKSRTAVRGVLGRAKAGWEGSEGYESLEERMRELKI